MERDGFRCRDCGRTAHEARKRFEVHHLVMVSEGGTNEAENLVTLCSDCHAGRHALRPGQTVDELLEPGDSSEPDRAALLRGMLGKRTRLASDTEHAR